MRFCASLTFGPEYARACEVGFDAYFDGMWFCENDDDEFGAVFVDRFYTRSEVLRLMIADLVGEENSFFAIPSLAWRAGFWLGWLSALALTDRALVLSVLTELSVVVDCLSGAPLCC